MELTWFGRALFALLIWMIFAVFIFLMAIPLDLVLPWWDAVVLGSLGLVVGLIA